MIDIETLLCRTIGCTSLFAWRWEWPHRLVCTKYTNWRYPFLKEVRKQYKEAR
jgi:hypothetical protein